MTHTMSFWLVVGWAFVAQMTFLSWVGSDIFKPEMRTEPRSWRRFATDYAFYLSVSLLWPLVAVFVLLVFAWVAASSTAHRSP
jgi:hypothetical protein